MEINLNLNGKFQLKCCVCSNRESIALVTSIFEVYLQLISREDTSLCGKASCLGRDSLYFQEWIESLS